MQELLAKGECPFCNFTGDVIKESEYWFVIKNRWPYENTKEHYLVVFKDHVTRPGSLSKVAFGELLELSWTLIDKGLMAVRFGESDFGNYGASIQHLHVHLIEPDLEHGTQNKWEFTYGKKK